MLKRVRNQKGFTLIELIVVIAILGILAAIAIPRFAGFQANANLKAVKSTLKTIDEAGQSVASDKNEALTAVTQDDILGALGWSAMPNNQPKGVTYTWETTGNAQAAFSGIPWPTGAPVSPVTTAELATY